MLGNKGREHDKPEIATQLRQMCQWKNPQKRYFHQIISFSGDNIYKHFPSSIHYTDILYYRSNTNTSTLLTHYAAPSDQKLYEARMY